MRDFLAAVGLLTICALIGIVPGLIRLWLSSRKYRRVHRALLHELSTESYVKWSSAEPLTFDDDYAGYQ